MEFTQEIFDRINSFDTIKAGWEHLAAETGFSIQTIRKYYYKFKKENRNTYTCRYHNRYKELLPKIVKEVSKNPDNLSECFRKVSAETNEKYSYIQQVYYNKIKNNPNYSIFAIISKKSGHINVKNNYNNKYPKHKTTHSFIEQIWGKIKQCVNKI